MSNSISKYRDRNVKGHFLLQLPVLRLIGKGDEQCGGKRRKEEEEDE